MEIKNVFEKLVKQFSAEIDYPVTSRGKKEYSFTIFLDDFPYLKKLVSKNYKNSERMGNTFDYWIVRKIASELNIPLKEVKRKFFVNDHSKVQEVKYFGMQDDEKLFVFSNFFFTDYGHGEINIQLKISKK